MATLRVDSFGGMAPGIEPRRLADGLATSAQDCSFEAGALGPRPFSFAASTDFTGLLPTTRAVLRPAHNTTRLAFGEEVTGEAFASMVAPLDKWGRVYFTTAQGPRFTVADNYIVGDMKQSPISYALGVKSPQYSAVVGTPSYAKDATEQVDLVKVAYIFTFVDKYGHEGAPSAASTIVEIPTDRAFTAKLTFIAESLPDTNVTGAVRRIYRAAFDGQASYWQYVGEAALALSTWTDSVPFGSEAEELISRDWVAPPKLTQMVPMASSFAAGFIENRLCYSELRLPHAWPEAYQYTLKYQIVGLKPTQNGLLIATTGKPYWAFGSDPASAVPVELDANYPCLSAKSMVDMGGYVVYASQDGLVAVAGQDVKVITSDFIDRLTWLRDFAPAAITAFAYEGRYVFGVGTSWWVFDPAAGAGFTRCTTLTVPPASVRQAYYDALRDTTVLLDTQGKCWDIVSQYAGAYFWQSKAFEVPFAAWSAGRVRATQYPVTLEVRSDGQLRSYTVTSDAPFRLAAVGRARVVQLAVRASGRVTEVVIGSTPSEV